MNSNLKKAFNILNKNLLLVITYGILCSFVDIIGILKLNKSPIIALGAICSIIIYIFGCGVSAALWQYSTEGEYDFIKGIKRNFAGYICANLFAIFAFIIISILVAFFIKGQLPIMEFLKQASAKGYVYAITMSIIYGVLFVYLNPFVFIKDAGVNAVSKGINYLFANFKESLPPVALALCCAIVHVALSLLSINKVQLFFALKIILIILMTIISSYLLFLTFLVACFVLDKYPPKVK